MPKLSSALLLSLPVCPAVAVVASEPARYGCVFAQSSWGRL